MLPARRSLPETALRTALVCLCLIMWAAVVQAAPSFPALTGRVVDQANLLTPEAEADLTARLQGLENATTDQFVVVTLNSLDGYEIADYGYQLGRHWGIGQKTAQAAPGANSETGAQFKDNGVLLIVAPNERKVRIEVGYGLEPVLTDAWTSIVIQNGILPSFRTGDYQAGIVNGADAIIEQLSIDRGTAVQKAQAAQQPVERGERIPPWAIIVIILFFILFGRGWLPFFLLGSLGGGGGGWRGGGGGGFGGFSGGGGSFGGGGSSGSW